LDRPGEPRAFGRSQPGLRREQGGARRLPRLRRPDDPREAGGAGRAPDREPWRRLRSGRARAAGRARRRAAILGRGVRGRGPDAGRRPRPRELADEPLVHPMTMVVRRAAFEAVGDFNESMRAGEDLDWMLRAAEEGVEIARLADVLLRRRVHADSLTQDADA